MADSLEAIRAAVKAHDDALNHEAQPGGPRVPTGDDYNQIHALVMSGASDVCPLRAALEAAEHWLAEEAASPHPGQTRPDDILRTIRAALSFLPDCTPGAAIASESSTNG